MELQQQRAAELIAARENHDVLKKAFEDAAAEYRRIEADFWQDMEDEGLKTLTLDIPGVGTVNLQRRETLRASVLDKEILAANVGEEFREQGFRQKALNELVRDRLASGEPLPEGLDFFSTRRVAVSKR